MMFQTFPGNQGRIPIAASRPDLQSGKPSFVGFKKSLFTFVRLSYASPVRYRNNKNSDSLKQLLLYLEDGATLNNEYLIVAINKTH